MKRFLLSTFVLFMALCFVMPAEAQQRPRRKPAYDSPMPQSSHFPIESYVAGYRLPLIVQPIEATPAGRVPDVELGLTLAELRERRPSLRLRQGDGERIVYTADDTVFYELYNNHVVLIRSEVKGGWGYPDEQWFVDLGRHVEQTAFSRANGINGLWQYFYGDWMFTIRYNPRTDIYTFRYEYLPSHQRFDELKRGK